MFLLSSRLLEPGQMQMALRLSIWIKLSFLTSRQLLTTAITIWPTGEKLDYIRLYKTYFD